MGGYYDDPTQTSEAVTSDGWFKTGDIGEWDKNGHLKLIDRKKNLVKTRNGEYIAIEKVCLGFPMLCYPQLQARARRGNRLITDHANTPQLESIYRSAPSVGNICVYASDLKTKPIAIIVPLEPALAKLAAANNIPGHGLENWVHEKKINGLVLKELQATGRSGGLAGIEIVEAVVLVDEEWNPMNGLTTSAQKLNRRAILERYKRQVDEAYSKVS
jgi:long-chain acyl-CoA synthetase